MAQVHHPASYASTPPPLRLETLEDRLLLSLAPRLLKDINTTPLMTSPTDLVKVGPVVYFGATDAQHGTELWARTVPGAARK